MCLGNDYHFEGKTESSFYIEYDDFENCYFIYFLPDESFIECDDKLTGRVNEIVGKEDYCRSILSDVDPVPTLVTETEATIKDKPLDVTSFGMFKVCIERLLVFNDYAQIFFKI